MFEKQGKYFFITIDNHKILYWDKLQGSAWGGPLQYLPPDEKNIKKIDASRNRIPAVVKELLVIPKEEMAEFVNAKDDNELMELVLRDCKRHGCKIVDIKKE